MTDMKKWRTKDWSEVAIIFIFLLVSVILLGFVGALFMDLIVSWI